MLTVIQKFSHSLCHSGQIVRTSSISDWHLTTRKEGMVATYRTLKEASPSTQRCEFPSTLAAANLLFACDQQQNVIGHGVGGFVRRSQPKKIQVFMTKPHQFFVTGCQTVCSRFYSKLLQQLGPWAAFAGIANSLPSLRAKCDDQDIPL